MNIPQGVKFVMIPISLLDGLSPFCQLVILWICAHSNNNNECWPSISLLQKETGLGKNTIIRAIKKLELNGILVKQRRSNDKKSKLSNLYKIITPSACGELGLVPVGNHPSACGELGLVPDRDPNYINKTKLKEHILIADSQKDANQEQKEQDIKIKIPKKERTEIPFQQIADLYNEIFKDENITYVKKLSVIRQKHIRKRWENELPNIEDWKKYFLRIRESDFLCGRNVSEGRKPFFADFDWIINESNCIKILEDKYTNVRYEK